MADSGEGSRERQQRKVAHMRAMADRYAERFHATAGRDAASVANEIHGTINEVIRRDRETNPDSRKIRCQRGCSHCCSNPVEIWPQEAVLLVKAAREAGIELDRDKLERQARRTIDDWREQPAADRTCIFLGADGACRVYASRPNACRKLLVTSDPALCDTNRQQASSDANPVTRTSSPVPRHPDLVTGAGEVERWFSWEAEMVEVAALETFGRGLMPRLLLARLSDE